MADSPSLPVNRSERLISVVVPCFNEEENLGELIRRVSAVAGGLPERLELILVDDGSHDRTWKGIHDAAVAHSWVRGFRLSRNFGQQGALFSGLAQAGGDLILIVDGDLQDPPELLPAMLERIDAGADAVYGQRQTRREESWFKLTTAKWFYRMLGWLADVPIPANTGDFRLVRRRVLEEVLKLREQKPFGRGLFAWVGFCQEPLLYDRDPRNAGATKWKPVKLLAYAMDAITAFSLKPLRVASLMALMAVGFAALVVVYAIVSKALGYATPAPGWTSGVLIIAIFSAGHFLALGVVGEYLARVIEQTRGRPLFIVAESTDEARVPNPPETAKDPKD